MKPEKVSPNVFVNNIQATVSFYERLGFVVSNSVTSPEGELVWVMMDHGGVTFMFQTFKSLENTLPDIKREDGGSLLLYVSMRGIRQFYDRVKGQVTVLTGLEKTFYGATEFSIRDNNNYVLTFAEHE